MTILNANNTFTDDVNGKRINNSFCTYDYETVCNRPFADNYDELATIMPSKDVSVCGDEKFKDNGNYIDVYEYDMDEDGNFKKGTFNVLKKFALHIQLLAKVHSF